MAKILHNGILIDETTGVVIGQRDPVTNTDILFSGSSSSETVVDETRIQNKTKIRSAIGALGRASYARVNVGWLGHSIISGVGSDNVGNSDFTAAGTWRSRSMASVLGRLLSAGFEQGLGVESFVSGHLGHFTLGGTAALSTAFGPAGVGGNRVSIATGSTATITFLAKGTAVRIYGYATAAGIQATYAINGGSAVNAPAAGSTLTGHSATAVWYEFNITGLTVGDSIQLRAPTSGTYVVYLVDLDYKTTAGVTMHRLSNPGQMAVQVMSAFLDSTDTQGPSGWVGNTGGAGGIVSIRTAAAHSLTTRLGLDLALCTFDVNDMKGFSTSGTSWGYTLESHRRHMNNFLAFMAAQSIPVIIVMGMIRNPQNAINDGVPYDQAELIEVYKECSDASTNAAYIDLTAEFTGTTLAERYAAQQASGLILDTVHPTMNGHGYYAKKVHVEISGE